MPEIKINRWTYAGKWALRWLIVPPLVFLAAGILLIGILISRECRDARVVLGGNLPDSMPVTLLAWHSRGAVPDSSRDDVGTTLLWQGPIGKGPILIPFAIPYTGHFEIRVEDPTGPSRSEKLGYISNAGDTHYIFIGRKEIVHSGDLGGFRDLTGEISPISIALGGISTIVADKLSCVDRRLWDAFLPAS